MAHRIFGQIEGLNVPAANQRRIFLCDSQADLVVISPEMSQSEFAYVLVDDTKWRMKTGNVLSQEGTISPTAIAEALAVSESPLGQINGSNATFTTSFSFIPGTVQVSINGLSQKLITHFQTVGNNTLLFTESPQTGDTLEVNYIKA